MEWRNGNRKSVVVVVIVAMMVVGGGIANADFTFGEPTNLGPKINTRFMERGGSLSSDGLMFFFDCDKPDGRKHHIYMVIRDTIDDDWSDPVGLGSVINDQMYSEIEPAISSDGLELYYSFGAPVALGVDRDLYVAKRDNTTESWANPVSLGSLVNGPRDERSPSISGDGLSLYFGSDRPDGLGGWDLWVTTRSTRDDDWGAPVNLGPMLNSPGNDFAPSITSDGLALIFSSGRTGSTGQYPDVWMTTRRSTSDPWREPINLGPIINTDDENGADISPDGSMLFVTYWKRPGGYGVNDIWQAPIIPIVDFNGDKIVDAADMCIMVDHWGENYPLCDIGPTPWGDGIIDVQDLTILGEHLFKEVISIGSFTEKPIGVYTMTDRSVDVYGSADQFHFGYKTLTGPGTIVARIESMTNTHPWAKAGVMIRETRDAGSKHAFVFVTPGKGVHFQGRSDTSGETVGYAQQTGVTAPHWVRLEWDGQGNFMAAHSPDGSIWQSVGGAASVSISMNSDVHIGLALCSHNMAEMCEAVFTDVAINGSVGSEWASTDINIVFRLP